MEDFIMRNFMNKHLFIIPISMGLMLSACGNKKDDNSASPPPPAPTPTPQQQVPGQMPNGTLQNGQMGFPRMIEFADPIKKCNIKYQVNNMNEYCSSLLDEGKNNNCAKELRQQTHYLNCVVNQNGLNPQTVNTNNMMGFVCQIHGVDNSNGFSFNKKFDYTRMIPWNGKKKESFNLSFLGMNKYGKAKLYLNPADRKTKTATMEIKNTFGDQVTEYSVVGSVINGISLSINNVNLEKDVTIDCLPAQKINSELLAIQTREVHCQGDIRDSGKTYKIDRKIIWDTKSSQDYELDDDARAVMRFNPSANGNNANAEVFIESDSGSKIYAKTFANAPIKIKADQVGTRLNLNCSIK